MSEDPNPTPQPEPTPTPEPGNWYDNLSPDLKNNPTVQKYSNNEEQIKGHLELQKTLGTDRVAIPKDANDTDAWAKINGIRGVPEKADDYRLNAVKAPEGMGKEFDRFAFQEQMKEISASPQQAQKLWENHTSMLTNGAAAASEQFKSQVEDAKAVMMQEHGEAYESMIQQGQDVINTFAKDEAQKDAITVAMAKDPYGAWF